jgi:tripartite ATP-independent transporter DctP family solute receptor
VLALAHGLDVTHPVHRAMVLLSERVAALSADQLRVSLYPSEQLGSERECLELLQVGSLAMTKVSSSVLENFSPGFQVFGVPYLFRDEAPYLFRDEAHRFAVLDGPIGRNRLLVAERYGLRGLAYYDAGTRSFYTRDVAVKTPADLAGLKIRTQESPMAIALVNGLGGSATPVAWGELYAALQQGVVDGAENNPPSFYYSGHYEVARFYTLDEHTGPPDVLLVGTRVWRSLSEEERGWLTRAVDESVAFQRRLWRDATEEALRAVRAAGVEVIVPDKQPFMARAEAQWRALADDPEIGALLRGIRDGEAR